MKFAIKERAKELALTQQEIANKLGVSQPFVNQIANGGERLTWNMAQRLAPILEIQPLQLMFGEALARRRGREKPRQLDQVVNHVLLSIEDIFPRLDDETQDVLLAKMFRVLAAVEKKQRQLTS